MITTVYLHHSALVLIRPVSSKDNHALLCAYSFCWTTIKWCCILILFTSLKCQPVFFTTPFCIDQAAMSAESTVVYVYWPNRRDVHNQPFGCFANPVKGNSNLPLHVMPRSHTNVLEVMHVPKFPWGRKRDNTSPSVPSDKGGERVLSL